jgi:hypothetical protein
MLTFAISTDESVSREFPGISTVTLPSVNLPPSFAEIFTLFASISVNEDMT